jgi:hypothetical protein
MGNGEQGIGRNAVLMLIGATLIVAVVVIRIAFSREVWSF